jgi:hypothetical protein
VTSDNASPDAEVLTVTEELHLTEGLEIVQEGGTFYRPMVVSPSGAPAPASCPVAPAPHRPVLVTPTGRN